MAVAVKQTKNPTVLQHYDISEYKNIPPTEDLKPKCKYCGKRIIGSVRVITDWWKHLVCLVINNVVKLY